MGTVSAGLEQTSSSCCCWASWKRLIQLCKTKQLVVAKLARSGVAAHLIGGTTVYNFFSLDIDYNSTGENGTVEVACVKDSCARDR